MSFAWAPGTLEVYGSGLLIFHVFCDGRGIPERSTLDNYYYGVRAWHILHNIPWLIEQAAIDALLKAATTLAPQSSKRKKRLPYTVEVLIIILHHLDLTCPLDAAVWSCLTTVFLFRCAGGGVHSANAGLVRPCYPCHPFEYATDRHNLTQTAFFILRTKSAQAHGEDAFWSRQDGPTDPESALNNHFAVNNPLPTSPLFSYLHKNSLRPLTKSAFLKRLHVAFSAAQIEPLQGHGIRIGSTLEYLLRGVPFDVVKSMGRWASESFTVYLRKHAQIMAPYMQADSALQAAFFHRTMPPVR
ncbi:DNA breaking-rejoining enzyme [Mycena sanguinolenta]|uniref:DNA breaking-rejoining enzyme n=1 Tax=Mycena sanguinolenta TaxID=230812 RepID=A0A8H6XX71_9AGAR|nr:DNA breaking-rejoining enzyme [Mycena sanguinolenta]